MHAGALTIHGETIVVQTDQRIELVDLTNRVMEYVRRFNIREGIVSLWSVNATGTSVKRILNDGSDIDRNPAFTPNGQRLIFFSDVGDSDPARWVIAVSSPRPTRSPCAIG